ncbi:uncharacterized protein FA14DRAFT_161642 [Meira miltonrushii]|uniref:Uncharacterized protein n=1 Tax=Meira miltonrushii TaxID=1280837 RepID=A0A316V941_9BASI|nr:uncharacterized protein FA14DRAFT_161642 [Meira miltonrushii]PWN34119.1 hypothetical protein FA14DRAFT_161642 [Meira miltonrushii]
MSNFGDFAQFGDVSLHHVPNAQAPSLLANMLLLSFGLGLITMELFGNVAYDIRLIKKEGWKEPMKASNRISYFLCRHGSAAFLILTILFLNVPGMNCKQTGKVINILFWLALILADFIFFQRTLAVYGWRKNVVIPLTIGMISYAGMSLYSIIFFGQGYQIPFSDFCGYQVLSIYDQPHATIFIVFICLMLIFNTVILLLCTHKLMEGGLTNTFALISTKSQDLLKSKEERKAAGHDVGEFFISNLLLRQGIGYFLILVLSYILFLTLYYTLGKDNTTSYQVLCVTEMVVVGPLVAGLMFRQTSEALNRSRSRYGSSECQCQFDHRTSNTSNAFSNNRRSGRSSTVGVIPTSPVSYTPKPSRGRSTSAQPTNRLSFTHDFDPTRSPSTLNVGSAEKDTNLDDNSSKSGGEDKPLQIFVEEKTDIVHHPTRSPTSPLSRSSSSPRRVRLSNMHHEQGFQTDYHNQRFSHRPNRSSILHARGLPTSAAILPTLSSDGVQGAHVAIDDEEEEEGEEDMGYVYNPTRH